MAEMTKEELNSAISRLKTNKSQGPNWFSPEWYKTFRTELIPNLLNIFNTALKEGKTPAILERSYNLGYNEGGKRQTGLWII